MSTMTQHATGMFCWTQLGTHDPEQSKTFYSGLFGWSFEDTNIDGTTFTLVKKNGKDVGGLYRLLREQSDRGIEPSWEPFVAVENADRATAKVRESRGKVLAEPSDVLDHGRFAAFEDPTGAAFLVWQAKKQIGSEIVNEVGSMCWNELITHDSARAGEFYRQVFGWTLEPQSTPMPMGGTYTVFKKNGAQAGGMIQATQQMRLTHPYWMVYFGVDDCDRSAANAERLGGKKRMPPTDIPDIGRFAVLSDPQGAYFSIIAMSKKK